MITSLLKTALDPVAERHRSLRRFRGLAVCWAGTIAVAVGIIAAKIEVPLAPAALGLIAMISAWLMWRRGARWEPDHHALARTIEERHPELHALLVTAVEQRPDAQSGELNFLQQRVIAEAIRASRERSWIDAIPRWKVAASFATQALLFGAMIFALTRLPEAGRRSLSAAAEAGKSVTITPGDALIERGSGLVVLAKFPRNVPTEAVLVVTPENQPAQRLPLTKNLDDPVFGGGLPEVDANLTYHVEFAAERTREFKVRVFEYPRLERSDARLIFPEYTRLPEKKIADTRRVSAVEGTKLSLTFQLNKPVKSAELIAKNQPSIALAVSVENAVAELRDLPLMASQSYELRLVDADGRASKVPAQFTVEVLPNRRPELKFIQPKGDQRVSALQEISFVAEAWDDFGMPAFGLSFTVAGGESKEVIFTRDTKPDERVEGRQMLKLEELGVKPDELISWSLWADDIGPDGKVRRTSSDLFFAEVRPFEEIFRPGQESEGKAAEGKGEEVTKLAELQKQIIAATWNLQRSEAVKPDGKLAEKYLSDAPVVRDSQAHALETAEAMQEKIEQPRARAFMETATGAMKSAGERLGEALTSTTPLPAALTSEQAAYNALLKLAAHEFQVSKSMSTGKASSSQNRQQELEQLDLKEEKKRYETKQEAEPQQNEQQRALLAILSRLKELAQRQQDINERLKELQTALQEAKDDAAKEEIRRRLKRLREEEQQLVADADEARQKMEQPANAAASAEARKQLEQTRNEAQKAAESMERGAVPQALASGSRAERELQQLRDDFRKKSSGRFADEMREMRTDARELAAKQEEIAKQLAPEEKKSERRTLDGSGEKEQLAQEFDAQQEKLGKVREAMTRVSEQAEAVEPLLAKELYDTLRKNTQAGTAETLKRAGQLATNGFGEHARKFEAKAREEIEQVKSGVERAAESVLGNEAEALRTARAELDALSEQLNREIAQADPSLAQNAAEPGKGEGTEMEVKSAESGDAQKGGPPGEQAGKPAGGEQGEKPGSKGRAAQAGNPASQTAQNSPSAERAEAGTEPGKQTGAGDQKGSASAQNGDGGRGQQPGNEQAGSGATAQSGSGGPGEGEGSQNSEPTPDGSGKSGAGARPGGALRQMAAGSQSAGGGNAGGGGDAQQGPIGGDGFVQWSDRLRNVEEMLDQPALRNQAAQVRETARGVRAEFKRNATQPKWDEVKLRISAPLAELRNRLSEELARRESKESLVPIDRDPVPAKFAEQVRKYYEDLGRSETR